MIQRIQSIFLLIVAITMLVLFFVPICSKVGGPTGQAYTMGVIHLQQISTKGEITNTFFPYAFMGLLAGIAVSVAIGGIFSYSNRLTQIKLGILNTLIITVLVGLMLYLSIQNTPNRLPHTPGQYKLGFILPAIAIISNMLANHCIRRDQKLVKSSDRFR